MDICVRGRGFYVEFVLCSGALSYDFSTAVLSMRSLTIKLFYFIFFTFFGTKQSVELFTWEILILCKLVVLVYFLVHLEGSYCNISSLPSYIFNIATQLIDNKALHRQCCHILSILIRVFQNSTLKEKLNTLGEQLQVFLKSLIIC